MFKLSNYLLVAALLFIAGSALASKPRVYTGTSTLRAKERVVAKAMTPRGHQLVGVIRGPGLGPRGAMMLISQRPNGGGPYRATLAYRQGKKMRKRGVNLKDSWFGDGLGTVVRSDGTSVVMAEYITGVGRSAAIPFQANTAIKWYPKSKSLKVLKGLTEKLEMEPSVAKIVDALR